MMQEDREKLYEQLREHLNTHPVCTAPAAGEINEILRLMFTPEEAELALHLTFLPQGLSSISWRIGRAEDETRQLLEQMADKGLVRTVASHPEYAGLYSLLPTMPGLFETALSKGTNDQRTAKLAELWQRYYSQGGWGKEVHRFKTIHTRVIPIEESISSGQEVLPYESAVGLLDMTDFISLGACACRHSAKLLGKGCDKPTDTCLYLGEFGMYMAERGYATEITRAEAVGILARAAKAGLVHVAPNFQGAGATICSCCTCCCVMLRAISEFGKQGSIARSRFLPSVDSYACFGCGACEESCQFNAIEVDINVDVGESVARVNEDNCLGCGLCALSCPGEAISFQETESYQSPFSTAGELLRSCEIENCK